MQSCRRWCGPTRAIRTSSVTLAGATGNTLLYVNASTGASGTVGLLSLRDLRLNVSGQYVAYLTNVKHVQSHNLTAAAVTGSIKSLNGSSPANVTNDETGVIGVIS